MNIYKITIICLLLLPNIIHAHYRTLSNTKFEDLLGRRPVHIEYRGEHFASLHRDFAPRPITNSQYRAINSYMYEKGAFDYRAQNFNAQASLDLDEGLSRINNLRGFSDSEVYSVQLFRGTQADLNVLDVGDYVVANGSPWKFTQSASATTARLTEAMQHSTRSLSPVKPILYRVQGPWHGKPIATFASRTPSGRFIEPITDSGVVAYRQGSSFKIIGMSTKTVKVGPLKNMEFTEVLIKEEPRIQNLDANIYDFRGRIHGTPAKLHRAYMKDPRIPRKLRVKLHDPKTCSNCSSMHIQGE